ncbi:MAG: class I SAM-dependent methyltransferase [Cyanophyceae cyanobacterium]
MSAPFDFEGLFDNDYLYFYDPNLTAERSEREVELIWQLLALEGGMSVLDLACGHGRITNRLAQRGGEMTGLDVTPLFLERARQDTEQMGVEVEYVEGDMRSLPWTERFDCIVNWFTAYGYFNDKDNRRVLAEVYRALKPGGKFLIEHPNRDRVLKNFQSAWVTERDDNYLIDLSQYNLITGCVETERIVIRDGQVRRLSFFVRLFPYTELRDWLMQAGFSQVGGYGSDGEPLTLDSRRMYIVAHK